jgi:hypothetical protein
VTVPRNEKAARRAGATRARRQIDGPAAKMQRYRQRLRAAGLRPLQIWVPDTTVTGVRRSLRAQSLRASHHRSDEDAQPFLDAALLDLLDS